MRKEDVQAQGGGNPRHRKVPEKTLSGRMGSANDSRDYLVKRPSSGGQRETPCSIFCDLKFCIQHLGGFPVGKCF